MTCRPWEQKISLSGKHTTAMGIMGTGLAGGCIHPPAHLKQIRNAQELGGGSLQETALLGEQPCPGSGENNGDQP